MSVIYISTYTKKELHVHGKAKDIYSVKNDDTHGILSSKPEAFNPYFSNSTGKYLFACNQDSGTKVTFRIDQVTWEFTNTRCILDIKTPVSFKFCLKLLR